MKAKQLIELLQDLDEDTEIILYDTFKDKFIDFEYGCSLCFGKVDEDWHEFHPDDFIHSRSLSSQVKELVELNVFYLCKVNEQISIILNNGLKDGKIHNKG